MLYRIFPSGTRKAFRAIATALIIVSALFLQGYLVTRSSPVDVAPYAWRAQRGQELTLTIPDPKQAVFSHDGYANEYVDILFEKARLAPETLSSLKRLRFEAPAGPAAMKYITEVEDIPASTTQEPGKTTIEMRPEGTGSEPPILHLFQLSEVEDHPYLEMITERASLHISMRAVPPGNGDHQSPGCRKSLWIGGKRLKVNVTPITIVAEPDSNVRFHFYTFKENPPLWGADTPFKPFASGKATVRAGDLPGFPVSEFGIRPVAPEGASILPYLYLLRSPSPKQAAFRMEGLTIGLDNRIQANLTGRGWITGDKNQQWVQDAVSLSTRLRNQFPLVALFAGMDVLVLFSSVRRFARRRAAIGALGTQEAELFLPQQAPRLLTSSIPESQHDLADLRERMTERLTRSEVGTVWFDILGDQMDDEMPGRPLSDCVIELLTQVHHRDLLPQLQEELRASYPHVLKP